jgi:hypothetical protein
VWKNILYPIMSDVQGAPRWVECFQNHNTQRIFNRFGKFQSEKEAERQEFSLHTDKKKKLTQFFFSRILFFSFDLCFCSFELPRNGTFALSTGPRNENGSVFCELPIWLPVLQSLRSLIWEEGPTIDINRRWGDWFNRDWDPKRDWNQLRLKSIAIEINCG